MNIWNGIKNVAGYLWPTRAAVNQSQGHPAAGVIGWQNLDENSSGVVVTEDIATNYAAVWCAVRVISETVASLPCILYQRTADGKDRATDDPRYSLVHDMPNEMQSAYGFFETETHHLTLWGNSYARIVRDGAGRPGALEPRLPDRVRLEMVDDSLIYTVQDLGETLEAEDMLHVAGLSFDGIKGLGVIRKAAQTIGTGIAAEQYAGGFFGNGARPDGMLVFPTRLDKEKREALRREWNEIHQGAGKANKIAIMHGGIEYHALGMSNHDAQFLESRKFSVTEIARWFRIPPHMLADLERSTFSNIEMQSLEFVVYSLTPWLRRWESTLNRKLLSKQERGTMFFEFLIASLLRGDIQSRYQAYSTARQWGWLSVNDIRRMENMNTVDDGDVYLQPMNMQPAGTLPAELQNDLQQNVTDAVNEIRKSAMVLNDQLPGMAGDSVQQVVETAIASLSKATDATLASIRADRREIHAEMLKPPQVQVRGFQAMKEAAIEMIAAKLDTATQAYQKMATKAAKGQIHQGTSFLAWVDEFSPKYAEGVVDSLSRPCAAYAACLGVPKSDLADRVAALHVKEMTEAMLAASDGDREGFLERVQSHTFDDPTERAERYLGEYHAISRLDQFGTR